MLRSRILLAALLAASAVFAGCVGAPGETPAAGVQPSAVDLLPTASLFHAAGANVTLPLPEGVPRAVGGQYSIGVDATEPTLGVDAAGAVYMTGFTPAEGGRWPQPTVMKSADKGQTWEDVGPKLPTGHSPAPFTFDPYVVVDRATGRVFTDDIWPLSCGTLSFSDDQGQTWTTNPYSCGNSQVNDHQTLGVAKPRMAATVGYPNVVYRCVNNVAYAACAMSFNGGLTFTPQVPLTTQPGRCAAITGHIASDPEGRVFIGSSACGEENLLSGDLGVPSVHISENDGLTWRTVAIDPEHVADEGTHDVEIASDEAGNLYAVWSHQGHVWMSRSFDHGATWTPGVDVTAPGVTATMFSTVAAAGPGKVAIAYVGSTIEGGYAGRETGNPGLSGDIFGQPRLPEWDAATWNAYVGVITDGTAEAFTVQTVTANDPADPIARGLCGRTRCHGMNDFIDVEVDAEGRPWAAFVDVCTKACVTDPSVHSDEPLGFVATLVEGPALLADGGALAPILPPPTRAAAEE